MEFEALYRAVESRDERFDGRVFVGVLSTGVYLRPICPATMPHREHVRFYARAAAAEEAGFRACRRCRPESSPDSPDWDVRGDLVGRALRLIAEGVVDDEGVEGLARHLAVGSRQLHRGFVAELGSGPLSIARSRRARLAKQLLEQTDLRSVDVAFATGFSSVRAYNDTVRRLYGRTPTEIRAARRVGDPHTRPLTLRLAFRRPFAAGPLLSFLAERAIPGIEAMDGSTFRRSVRTKEGRAAVIGLTPHPSEHHIALEVGVDEVPELGGIVQAARRLLDLDAVPSAIDDTLASDPALRPLVRRTPGIRLPGAIDGFELAVRAVLGQQVSVKAARTLAGRIATRLGAPLDTAAGPITHLFPSAEQLAEASFDGIGIPAGRADTLRRLAELVAVGKLDLAATADPEDTLRALADIPGVGPWTSAYVAMRALRDPDAFPAGDLGVRRGFEALGLPAKPAQVHERAERWRPWRAYAVMHLWNRNG